MALSHEHVGPKISAKIKVYILSRAKLLCSLCHEIPCIKNLCVFVKTKYVNCIKITHQCNFSSTISWNFFGTFLVCIIFAILALHTLKEKNNRDINIEQQKSKAFSLCFYSRLWNRCTLYNVILRILRNFRETSENIRISTHPFYHTNLD